MIQFGEVKRGQLGIKSTEMTADMAKTFKFEFDNFLHVYWAASE
ncbi:hypothetical protein ACZ87_03633 [Candidatus Erwinia dacicola]|uniref:Uncharacterized protein n=1 Tax=Candidatus Erwinia dacicola TaxID=252393 RepID=A0A328TKR0_9GAMM|nr:hypothetical protein ACZ87_03633 [Candidatus Erwinia dacicola]